MDSLKGQLLISGGGLFDPNFRHTVVLIGAHDHQGAVGVILNRPLDYPVHEALPALGEWVDSDSMLYQGGPVQPETPVLLVESASAGLSDVPVFDNVGFLVGDLDDEARGHIRRARVFVGHAGWAPGQLELELEEGSWILDQPRPGDVFTSSPERLWSRVVKRQGPEYELMSRMPYDPSMN